MFVRKLNRTSAGVFIKAALVGELLLCLGAGPALAQNSAERSIQVFTPPPPDQFPVSPPLLNRPVQIFDTPKTGRWPDGSTPADKPKTGGIPGSAATAPGTVNLPDKGGTATFPQSAAGQESTPMPPAKTAALFDLPPSTQAAEPITPAPLPAQPDGVIPLQASTPPPGAPPSVSSNTSSPTSSAAPNPTTIVGTPARQPSIPPSAGQSSSPAGGELLPLPTSAISEPSSTPAAPSTATPAVTPLAVPAAPETSLGTPAAAISPPAASAVSQASAQLSATKALAPQTSSSSSSSGQPDVSSEIPRLNFEGTSPAQPTPAPVAHPSSRSPAPDPGLVEALIPTALPELEPFDAGSPEALNFDAGRELGIRDDNTTPLQRFGDSIPHFTRDEMSARQQEEQESFTYNRGPAGQMGN